MVRLPLALRYDAGGKKRDQVVYQLRFATDTVGFIKLPLFNEVPPKEVIGAHLVVLALVNLSLSVGENRKNFDNLVQEL